MKKTLLFGLFCITANLSFAQQPFTENNLVVYRYGDAVATTAVPVFLDEYETTAATEGNAAKKQTIDVYTTTTTPNFRLRGIPKGGTNQIIEGYSSLSPDGNYLTIMGYDAPNGGGENNDKVIGLIDKNGNINTSQKVPNAEAPRPRNAITTDGSGFWIAPATAGTGIRYITNGGTNSTVIATAATGVRNLYIFGGQLYGASGSNNFYIIGNGLPVSGTNTVTPKALPGLGNNSQMVFFDVDAAIPGPDLIYVADDVDGNNSGSANAKLRKYKYDGTDWVAAGSITVPTLKSITGTIDGNNIVLYGASWGLPDGTIKSSLFKFTDNDAVSSNIDALTPFLLAEAPGSGQFRSVTFTPGTTINTTLPVELTSFVSKIKPQGVLLEWVTASEKNNAYFEVLKSKDGKTFNKIGNVKGSSTVNSATKYSYLDETPAEGVNYYKLKQVDLDGKSTESNVVSAYFSLENRNGFIVFETEEGKLRLNIKTEYSGVADFKIINISGKVVYTDRLTLDKESNNSIDIIQTLSSGIYVAILVEGQKVTQNKFVIK